MFLLYSSKIGSSLKYLFKIDQWKYFNFLDYIIVNRQKLLSIRHCGGIWIRQPRHICALLSSAELSIRVQVNKQENENSVFKILTVTLKLFQSWNYDLNFHWKIDLIFRQSLVKQFFPEKIEKWFFFRNVLESYLIVDFISLFDYTAALCLSKPSLEEHRFGVAAVSRRNTLFFYHFGASRAIFRICKINRRKSYNDFKSRKHWITINWHWTFLYCTCES